MKRFFNKAKTTKNGSGHNTAGQTRRQRAGKTGLPLFEALESRQLLSAAVLGTGTGLEGQYYDSMNLTNLVTTRVDPTINFNWTGTTPAAGVPQYQFSTKWTGQVQAEYSQTYTFFTQSDDGVRLWVNGQELVNNWTVHGSTQNSGKIALVAGQDYNIEMDYFQDMGASIAKLSWSSASQSKQVIPTSQLYPTATPTAPTAPTGLSATLSGNSQINLTWSEATSGVSGFDVLRSVAGGAYTQVAQVAGTATSYSDTGLAAATAYSYEVTAFNAAGTSAASNVASATTPAPTPAGGPPAGGNWTSIYNDTFSGSTLDSTWSNSMWGTTSAGCATIANNMLQLTAPNASTEELINTENSTTPFSFTYGYAQVTMQVPKGDGVYPAFWMMPLEVDSPDGSAGDIDAYNGQGNTPNIDTASYEWGESGSQIATPYNAGVDLSQGFHTYGVDWEQNQITWYLDGKAIQTVTGSQAAINSDPMYLILDVWLNGADGTPDSTTPFPATMNISNVQVWQNHGTPAPTAPSAPTGLSAVLSGNSQINLNWSESTSGVSGFNVLRSVAGGAYTQLSQVSATTTSYSDTGLAAGTAYSYEVTAFNSAGTSPASNVASATTPVAAPTLPVAPTGLTATLSGNSQINLAWSESTGGCTGFDVMCSVAGGSYSQVAQVAGSTTSYSATGLAAGTSYSYEVQAVNSAGTSTASNAASATTPAAPTAPAAPTGLTATLSGTSQINLAWSEATSGVTGFYVMSSVAGGAYTQLAQVSGTTTTYSNTGLAAGTSFSYEVKAYNATGNSAVSNVASANTPAAPTVPAAPTGLTATLSGTSQINLAWSEATAGVTGFYVMRSVSGGAYTQLAQVAGTTTTYSNTGLAAGTSFSYEVKAYNATGNSAVSNVASATTPAAPTVPAAPTGLTATLNGTSEIDLAWSEATSGVSGFYVMSSVSGGAYAQVAQVSGTTTTYANTGLAAGTTYSYEVKAFNAAGNSSVSNAASASTPSSTPPAGGPPIAGSWNSIFDDNFSGTSLDSSWSNQLWGKTYGGSATVSNNTLHLTAPNSSTEELIDTQNSSKPFSFTYGYAQVTMQVPKGQGIWPAFWLMPDDQYVANNDTEIDCYEGQGDQPSVDWGTFHWGTTSSQQIQTAYNSGVDLSQGYHTFGVDWEQNQITWYLDGKAFQTVTSAQAPIDPWPTYLILDVWLGGWDGGTNSSTPFPATANITNVQVWQQSSSSAVSSAPAAAAAKPASATSTLTTNTTLNSQTLAAGVLSGS